jgi:hypothetical protein
MLTREFLKPDCASARLGSPFNGVKSDIFRGIVFFRIGNAPDMFVFSLLLASWHRCYDYKKFSPKNGRKNGDFESNYCYKQKKIS